jgi:hypothetical protein
VKTLLKIADGAHEKDIVSDRLNGARIFSLNEEMWKHVGRVIFYRDELPFVLLFLVLFFSVLT